MKKNLALLLTAAAACSYSASAYAAGAAAPEPEAVIQSAEPAPVVQLAENSSEAVSAPAAAEVQPANRVKTKWEFIDIPYVWATSSMSTFTTRQGESVTSKLSFFDLLGDLKFG